MKVLMLPHKNEVSDTHGIGQVVHRYFQYLPAVGIELVDKEATSYDLKVGHASASPDCDVCHNHGLYWASYAQGESHAYQNLSIIKTLVQAKAITVPSKWVSETFKRDLRIRPFVIPHGIEFEKWQHNYTHQNYVLWNKNRSTDACDVEPVNKLAALYPQIHFVTTFGDARGNVTVTKPLPHHKMKKIIQCATVYLATTKETFGIGTLEALTSGVPVLGFDWGGTSEIITHKFDGYLVKPYDYESLVTGLQWLLENRDGLVKNCQVTAQKYSWQNTVEKVSEVYHKCLTL